MGKLFSNLLGGGDDAGEQAERQAERQSTENRAAEERARADADRRAAEDRAREDERKSAIQRSVTSVNTQFGQFDDAYYNNIADVYEQFYLPQVEEQARDARRRVLIEPAGGSTSSSASARRRGNLERDIERERIGVRSRALDAANEKRADVENNRARLLSSAEAGESFDSMQPRTTEVIKTLNAPRAYSPIEDLFTRYMGNLVNAQNAENAGFGKATMAPLLFGRNRDAERTVR